MDMPFGSPRLLAFVPAILLTITLLGCGSGSGTQQTSSSASGGSAGGPSTVAPYITNEPQSQFVSLGQPANFSVVASGTAPFSYQWYENNVAIDGANSESYISPPVSKNDSGEEFSVMVKNSAGSVTSVSAQLSVGPRAPELGDLRFQMVDSAWAQRMNNTNMDWDGISTDLDYGVTLTFNDAVATPLPMGDISCTPYIAGGCAWTATAEALTPNLPDLNVIYKSSAYINFESDFDSSEQNNEVMASLDLEPSSEAYAFEMLQSNNSGRYDGREEVISTGNLQQAAEKDGTESRVITALAFDNQGQLHLFSYGWSGDKNTQYDVQTILSPATSTGITEATVKLAAAGYIITAFGGNMADGFVLVGTKVHGDTMPRPLWYGSETPTGTVDMNNSAPVVMFQSSSGATAFISEG